MLLISALRDFYIALNELDCAEGIQKEYLLAVDTRQVFNKLTPCKIDTYTFENIVNINEGEGKIISLKFDNNIRLEANGFRRVKKSDKYINKNILFTYEYFYKNIFKKYQSIKNKGAKREFLLDLEESLKKLEIILIISENIESLFLFFDSLNNRGLQLSQIDIIRNNLLKTISSSKFKDDVEEFSYLWDKLVVSLDNFDGVKFLKYYFMCTKENKIFSSKELPDRYNHYFEEIDNKIQMKNEIEKMIDYAKIYTKLFDKSEEISNDKEYIKNVKRINELGQQACHSFLMDYFYNVSDENRRNKITSYIEKMMFRRIICNYSTKKLDGIFRDFIKLRTESENRYIYDDQKIIEAIKRNSPNDEEFRNMFINREWGRDNVTNYTLRKYEYYLTNQNGGVIHTLKSRKDVNIEHVMPEKYSEAWKKKLAIPEEKYQEYVSKIGNLILLEFDINTSVKDSLFAIKKNDQNYGRSTLKQVKQIIEYSDWNLDVIDKRTEQLSEIALEIWKL
ncbi:hypothetical protein BBF96_01375 [Anoxybacter fermentans]|uniref:GmrSD restriction endonucleases C-terminal domain-containing protein n=2 Tax=Anoxybacter fermentans TaxID=1323375 RepID=A0A3S9SV34_9FIRM|nr:hypothetical protein BBF96_01375 [Anoxybacter fermentans]